MQRESLLSVFALGVIILLMSSCFDSPVGSEVPTLENDTIARGLATTSDTSRIETRDTILVIPPVKPDTIKIRIPFDPSDPVSQEPPVEDTLLSLSGLAFMEDTMVYDFVEIFPEYPGGESALKREIDMHLTYPDMCKEMGVEGTLYLSFIVEKNGMISNITILRGIKDCPQMDKEAMRVFKKLKGTFSPGMLRGALVRTRMKWPLRLRLE